MGFFSRGSKVMGVFRWLSVSQYLGTKLLNHILDLSAKQNIKEIYLHVQTNNDDAISFYKKFGFEITDTIKNYYAKNINPPDCYVLSRTISASPSEKTISSREVGYLTRAYLSEMPFECCQRDRPAIVGTGPWQTGRYVGVGDMKAARGCGLPVGQGAGIAQGLEKKRWHSSEDGFLNLVTEAYALKLCTHGRSTQGRTRVQSLDMVQFPKEPEKNGHANLRTWPSCPVKLKEGLQQAQPCLGAHIGTNNQYQDMQTSHTTWNELRLHLNGNKNYYGNRINWPAMAFERFKEVGAMETR
ncbi:hypothetical protein Taro_031352 [Colocasia esculenta]|uniref:N-acetyltransferase domain-containing protein n=1 Tax=Colocasia esculenta TaxID=4460 RepID=A0A843VUE7_COLES|nr:hypothetical protein [Colocasia esculenta]